tara:strand:- start:1019 stop:1192 length:174 start_codon:yes stop_codon:yes gene_type:complete
MNTSFHVYDSNNTPVGDLINLDQEQLLAKINDRIKSQVDKELTIVKVEEEDQPDASY